MSDHYVDLTDGEKGYWDIYTRLRELSDWSGFSERQGEVKDAARAWLVNQRKTIWRLAQPKSEGGDGKGWDQVNRSERYEQLKDESLNSGSCRRVAQLPTSGGTPGEKAAISEREMWWVVSSVDDQTKAWRQANVDGLVSTRQRLYSLASETSWREADRSVRYENLCVATKHGAPYKKWQAGHDDATGEPEQAPDKPSARARAVKIAQGFIGVSEHPAGSNRGSPQPSGWQKRVYGSDGVAWCACFSTCMCWDAGCKGAGSAGVAVIMDLAKRGQGMFRGWTTDPSKAQRGDMLVIGCGSCHIGLVAETPGSSTTIKTVEGNTSPGSSGSQYNGGCVANRTRQRSEWVGFALVDYPG